MWREKNQENGTQQDNSKKDDKPNIFQEAIMLMNIGKEINQWIRKTFNVIIFKDLNTL